MYTKLREQAVKLRVEKEMSYSQIRKLLNVSKSTLSYWLREHPISESKILLLRRTGWKKSEAGRERFRETMRKKKAEGANRIYNEQKKKLQNLSDDAYLVAGLMLYLAEGDKRNPNRIVLANTDPQLISFFIRWIKKFLHIQPEKVRVQLHLYENMTIKKEKNFWKHSLKLDDNQFYKIQIRPLKKNSFSYTSLHRHGTCSVFVPMTSAKTELMMTIKAFLAMNIG